MTMIEARRSTVEPRAQQGTEIELAAGIAAARPKIPSPVIHARENQDSVLVRRAARSQPRSVFGGAAVVRRRWPPRVGTLSSATAVTRRIGNGWFAAEPVDFAFDDALFSRALDPTSIPLWQWNATDRADSTPESAEQHL